MAIKAIDPVSGKVLASYDEMTPTVVSGIISDVHEAFLKWRRTSFAERATMMREAAKILRGSAGEYARLMAQEMGKPVRDGVAEVEKCASGCDFYAEHAARFLAREPILTEARNSFVTFNPLGIVLAVMPWNFPFWQVFRFAAPGLMAGNAAVLKHASNVPGCALAIEDAFRRAGFPKNLFRTLMIGSPQVPSVIEHPLVRAVTLTRSGPAGRAVAGKAGQMLKKTVLELGGSDPYLAGGCGSGIGRHGQHQGTLGERRSKLHCRKTLHRGRESTTPIRGAVCAEDGRGQDGRPPQGGYPDRSVGAA
jgi:succinate-semialdehyde dehydrogenase / glutarate-semialdehyde dehydrogenase